LFAAVAGALVEQETAETTEMISLFPPSALFSKEPVMHGLICKLLN